MKDDKDEKLKVWVELSTEEIDYIRDLARHEDGSCKISRVDCLLMMAKYEEIIKERESEK